MPARLPEAEEARRRRALAAGFNDAQCARALRITRDAFVQWRRDRGLPPNVAQGEKLTEEEARARDAFFLENPGVSHAEAAEALGITEDAVRSYRRARALPRARAKELPAEEDARRRALHARGWSDARVAAEVGVRKSAIAAWRRGRGLPPNDDAAPDRRRPARAREARRAEDARRLLLYAEGFGDAEIAERVGATADAVRTWRRRRLLPPARPPRGEAWWHRTTPEQERALRLAHAAHASDADASRAAGVTPAAFRAWRRARGLARPQGSRGP